MAGCCEHDDELLCSVKDKMFLDQVIRYFVLKECAVSSLASCLRSVYLRVRIMYLI
jgi:hypothetical protein